MARKTDRSATPRVDIISIGTLGRNLLWGESQPLRTAHATTSLIRAGARNILVDPGLPSVAVVARLFERTGLQPQQIDTIFLTNFRGPRISAIELFSSAQLLIHEPELTFARARLESFIEQAPDEDLDRATLEAELELLERFAPAEDQLAPGVDLFPLPGMTPGTCGLLIAAPLTTTIIAGDAVPTVDHFLAGQMLPESHDLTTAEESFREVYEIADLIVPGYDNIFINPRGRGM